MPGCGHVLLCMHVLCTHTHTMLDWLESGRWHTFSSPGSSSCRSMPKWYQLAQSNGSIRLRWVTALRSCVCSTQVARSWQPPIAGLQNSNI
jgi:hypothetical protein